MKWKERAPARSSIKPATRRRPEGKLADRPVPDSSFIPAIDGLRGVAILAVLFFHLELPKCSLGWAGVELFFVISGFLITRILLKTRADRNYFRNFYCRRALRIFPIYYLVVLAYAAVLALSAGQYKNLLFYCVYAQTIPQLQSQFADMPMLGHTWTLAIEEQFYLIWPMAVFLLKGRKLLIATLAMVVTGAAVRFVSLGAANPFLVDGWLGPQVDALAAGAIVAFAFCVLDRKAIQRWTSATFLVGTASLLILVKTAGLAAFWTPKIWGRLWYGPLVLTAMACMFAGAVGLAATGNRWTRWLECWPLMRWGKISYGVYLFHPFVFLLVDTSLRHTQLVSKRHLPLYLTIALVKLSLTYAVAWISWQVLEGPINRLKNRFASRDKKAAPPLPLFAGTGEPIRGLA